MDIHKCIEKLTEIIDDKGLMINEPMARHTTFRIGGPADILLIPDTAQQLKEMLAVLRECDVPWQIIGNGSNMLVCDNGVEGAVIQLADGFSGICVDGDCINAQSGALLSTIANAALGAGLQGFEFAAGIPGTIGGAVVMNAGAYDGEMKDVLESVMVVTAEGELLELSVDQLALGYRTSCIQEKRYIVIGVRIRLEKGVALEIDARMKDYAERRSSKQPLHLPSAGSTFKRPVGSFAGKLIEESCLRGLRYGDAQVSEKHCGFVVNLGNADCYQVMTLINLIRRVVKNRTGVTLEPELRLIGRGFDA